MVSFVNTFKFLSGRCNFWRDIRGIYSIYGASGEGNLKREGARTKQKTEQGRNGFTNWCVVRRLCRPSRRRCGTYSFLGILLRRRHGAHHVLGARNFLVVPHGRAEPGVGGRVYEDHAESGHVCA